MRNEVLKLSAAAVLATGLGVAAWQCMRTTAPEAPPAAEARREESRRADEITDHVKQGQVGRARALADQFYRDYPNSPEIRNIERLTGYHPRPYGPSRR